MQPCSREMQAMNSVVFNQDHLQPDHDQISSSSHLHHPPPPPPPLHLFQSSSHFDSSSSDDFLDHFLSNLPPSSSSSSWQDLKSPWGDLNHSSSDSSLIIINKLGLGDLSDETPPPPSNLDALAFPEESPGLPAKLRNHQITSSSSPAARAAMILQQQQFMSGAAGLPPMPQSLSAADLERSDNDIVDGPSSFKTPILGGSTQAQSFGAQQGSVSGGAPAQSKPKVRARRGQATDPHSIAERLRRERIAERMKSLQELVPNANKTDKASMLDEIIDYVKFLQLQVKVLSMSRLGGAASVAPLVADISDGGGDRVETNGQGGAKSKQQTVLPNESLTMTEQQVAQLMEKDMGSAMQYLQGKGLCLMPISLATAISTSTGHSRNPLINHLLSANGDAPASPSMSVLTVQSTTLCANDASAKDVASVSKP